MINLYNTASRKKEQFRADQPVTVYTCGPTVYLDPHIGNWRTFIFYDTIVRALKLNHQDVKHVINITDVGHLVSDGDTGEDKLSKTAKNERKTAWEIAESYTQSFITGMLQLNILKPTKLPRATDNIPQQIDMIKAIEAHGNTYQIDDGIYFDTSTIKDYGKLAGANYEINEEFARINKNHQKKHPQDFALWKFSPKGEKRDMEWDSPWGIGFPGWHLECSAMAKTYLGDTLDIHAGGVDHIPIHHTNEIAQSETTNGVKLANFWMHAEFMKVNGTKMSKSLGNFYTLGDIQEKGFSALDFRMLVIQGHYRTETNFSWDNLKAAANRLANLKNAASIRWQINDGLDNSKEYQKFNKAIIDAINDDLNTPLSLQSLAQATNLASTNGLSKESAQAYIELLQTADKALGLNLLESTPDISDPEKQLLQTRGAARSAKDFAKADELRDKLKTLGFIVLDQSGNQIWQRIY